ncbi:unnamed protein product [Pylaiella littoralis]
MSVQMMASYAALFGLWTLTQFVLVPVPVNLILTSTLILYIGSHRSLRLRDKTSIESCESETLSKEAAMKAPIIGSGVLLSIYLLFKYVKPEIVNMLLAAYFAFIGAFALAATVDPILVQLLGTEDAKRRGTKLDLPLIGEVDLTFTLTEMVSLTAGAAVSAVYTMTRHWALNNIFGMTFCVQAMERVSLGSVKVAGILLVGLFIYDVTWVYGGPVMESVAKSVQGPIKILFVSAWADPTADPPTKLATSLLGLGDIVVPGLFTALMLRFDAVRANADPAQAEHAVFPCVPRGVRGRLGGNGGRDVLFQVGAARVILPGSGLSRDNRHGCHLAQRGESADGVRRGHRGGGRRRRRRCSRRRARNRRRQEGQLVLEETI